ncbi:MAG: methyl-accepting chemotaxis protein [Siculibacillus sp.]|nr:methyl-accepting chemotaxis protein [Siculibacillus sp.]
MFHFGAKSLRRSPPPTADTASAPAAETTLRPTRERGEGSGAMRRVVELLEADLKRVSKRLDIAGRRTKQQVVEGVTIMGGLKSETDVLADHTDVALDHVNRLAQGCQELHQSAEEVGRRADASQRLVDDASGVARAAARSVDELKQAIEQIQAVVALISDVAGQTNLLALNATIEAARAGAAGRGFAVVANEVKALSVETQKATSEIGATIHRLRATAEANIDAVGKILALVGDIGPVFGEVSRSVKMQVETTAEIGRSAAETARFVDEVAVKARRMSGEMDRAAELGHQVDKATDVMNGAVADMTRQLVTVLRQGSEADRRKHDRWPVELRGEVRVASSRIAARTIDLSLGGALIVPESEAGIPTGARIDVELAGLGLVRGTVVGKSSLGLHVAFADGDADARIRIGACIDRIEEEFRPLVTRATEGAGRVTVALDAAIERGELNFGDLFDTDYRPVAGSDPIQYETNAISALERILPPVQEELLVEDRRMTFCACVDINGWLPVHNKLYSQPQRPGEVSWNTANSRNKRIFDDRTGLLAARNTRPFLVQSYLRDLGGGKIIPMKEVDAPIVVKGRHWGGFRSAYQM